mmetsp:Transcript_161118/g.517112  ORF Transcript_161118/g.517112 Transcript_161118/m.517112 type:complete len:99 (+) Transcript_161118:324-620(+)
MRRRTDALPHFWRRVATFSLMAAEAAAALEEAFTDMLLASGAAFCLERWKVSERQGLSVSALKAPMPAPTMKLNNAESISTSQVAGRARRKGRPKTGC